MKDLERYRELLVKRFLRYVSVNTQSDEGSDTTPSTPGQLELAKILKAELESLGLQEVELDSNGYLYATLPSNRGIDLTIGFLAHLDTSPDAPGGPVRARIVTFKGKPIELGDGKYLDPEIFPVLKNYPNQELIVTDGTTLLGADDKAGIAEIVTAIQYLIDHPEFPRPRIRIAFTPDEEIGRGMDKFDPVKFGAKYAYTVDGEGLGTLEYETFNAASAIFRVKGVNVHPGYAKGIMKNAAVISAQIVNLLPRAESPEYTEGREGFFHVTSLRANVSEGEVRLLVRDHDKVNFQRRKELLRRIESLLKHQYGEDSVSLEIRDTYYNMREVIEKFPEVIEKAREAIREAGLTPLEKPVRGGTDGARLSFMGIPTPNIFSGGHNFHGPYEFLPIDSALKGTEVILNLIKLWAG